MLCFHFVVNDNLGYCDNLHGDNHESKNPLSPIPTNLNFTATCIGLWLQFCICRSVGRNSFGDGPQKFCCVRETYKALTNIFLICVGFPGSGKSQAYQMTVQEPLESLVSPVSTILVDDYVKKSLFRQHSEFNKKIFEKPTLLDTIIKQKFRQSSSVLLPCPSGTSPNDPL